MTFFVDESSSSKDFVGLFLFIADQCLGHLTRRCSAPLTSDSRQTLKAVARTAFRETGDQPSRRQECQAHANDERLSLVCLASWRSISRECIDPASTMRGLSSELSLSRRRL